LKRTMADPWAGMSLACALALTVYTQKNKTKLLIF